MRRTRHRRRNRAWLEALPVPSVGLAQHARRERVGVVLKVRERVVTPALHCDRCCCSGALAPMRRPPATRSRAQPRLSTAESRSASPGRSANLCRCDAAVSKRSVRKEAITRAAPKSQPRRCAHCILRMRRCTVLLHLGCEMQHRISTTLYRMQRKACLQRGSGLYSICCSRSKQIAHHI